MSSNTPATLRPTQTLHPELSISPKTQGAEIGVKLVCLGDDLDAPVPIYASPESNRMIGRVNIGDSVTVSGVPRVVDNFTMLPIAPAGAVQLDYFTLYKPELEEDELGEANTQECGHAEGGEGDVTEEGVDPA